MSKQKRVISLDSQILSAIEKCEVYTNLSFVENLTTLEKSEALDKGDLMHICIENLYNLRLEGGMEYSDMVEIAAQRGQEHAYGLDAPIETCLEVIKVFKQYALFYKGEDWIPLRIEHVFAKEMYNDEELQIIYQGKIDLVVSSSAGVLVVDHKTTSRRTNQLFLSNQFMGYCWALETHNMCINEIGYQKTLAPADKFRRFVYSYPKEIIDEWVEVSVFHIKEYLRHLDEGNIKPRFTSCRSVYGDCLFIPVCGSTPDARQWKKDSMYGVRKWDVGAKLEEDKSE